MRAEEDPLGDRRGDALARILEEEAGKGRTVWASFDWVRQVDLQTVLGQQERLTEIVDASRLVVKTAALEEAIDGWTPSELRRVQSAHAALILASVVLAVLGVVFLVPDRASACMCAIEGSQEERAERAISRSDAVFSGKVVGFEKLEKPPSTTMAEPTMPFKPFSRDAVATLRVAEVWKGPEQRTVRLTTVTPFLAGGSCTHRFEEGREYLVYANVGRDGLRVEDCSETKLLSNADADLALLGDGGEKPKEDDGEVLSDTSGGVSGRVMAGLAGLALAASFLVVMRLVRADRT